MSTFDRKRRGALKEIGAAALMAASAGVLDAAVFPREKSARILVLTGDSPQALPFLEGVRRARRAGEVRHETVRPITAFAALEALLEAQTARGELQDVTGLLNAGEYLLVLEALRRRGFWLKAEIVHRADAGGTTHTVTTSHTAPAIAVHAGQTLPLHPDWAFLSGAVLGKGCAPSLLAAAGANRFRSAAVRRPERGDAAAVSFLATVKKEHSHV